MSPIALRPPVARRAARAHLRWARPAALLALVVVVLALPQLGSGFVVSLGLSILIYGLLAMSFDVLAGYTGLISLGHAAFFGVGAYGTGHGLEPAPAALLALVAVSLTAAVFGLLVVRVRGLTFVILTLALGQIVWGLAYRWVSVSGGDNGLPVVGRPMLGPIDLTDNVPYYYFVAAIVAICAAVLWALVRSPFGLTLRGVRDNEGRMRTLGYNVGLHKYVAFAISAFFAGVAGVLFGFFNLYVSPTMIDFNHNGTVVQMAVVGGLGTLWGPLLGAGVIVLLQQLVSIYVARWLTLLGVIFVLTVLFARTGLWGGLAGFLRWVGRRLGPAPPAGPGPAEPSLDVAATRGAK